MYVQRCRKAIRSESGDVRLEMLGGSTLGDGRRHRFVRVVVVDGSLRGLSKRNYIDVASFWPDVFIVLPGYVRLVEPIYDMRSVSSGMVCSRSGRNIMYGMPKRDEE